MVEHEAVHQAAIPVIALVVQAVKLRAVGRAGVEDSARLRPLDAARLKTTLPLAAISLGVFAAALMHWRDGPEAILVEGVGLGLGAVGLYSVQRSARRARGLSRALRGGGGRGGDDSLDGSGGD